MSSFLLSIFDLGNCDHNILFVYTFYLTLKPQKNLWAIIPSIEATLKSRWKSSHHDKLISVGPKGHYRTTLTLNVKATEFSVF